MQDLGDDGISETFALGLEQSEDMRARLLEGLAPSAALRLRELWSGYGSSDLPEDEALRQLHARALLFALDETAETDAHAFSDFEILETLSTGSMGIVYKARQRSMDRIVALKVLPQHLDDPTFIWRFQKEQMALARMQHHHIGSVFVTGTTRRGDPYFAMEFLDGLPIHSYCDQHQLGIDARLRLFLCVCDAVHHAHLKGVIHRDIKPSNVLVIEEEGKAVPKLIDLGIAKMTDSVAVDRTEAQMIVGTRAYLSPEAIVDGSGAVDARTDIYALGLLLFELLVGETPHQRQLERLSLVEWLRHVAERELPPLHRAVEDTAAGDAIAQKRGFPRAAALRARLQGELSWIAAKAGAREPAQRYASCVSLAEDVERLLQGRAINAAPVSSLYKIKTFLRRNRAVAALTAALTVALVVGLIASLSLLARSKQSSFNQQVAFRLMASMFDNLNAYERGERLSSRAFLKHCEARFDRILVDAPEIEWETRLSLAKSYAGVGLHSDAVRQFIQLHDAQRLREPSPDQGNYEESLAYELLCLGKLEEARLHYEHSWALSCKSFGAEHPRSLQAASAKANVLALLGEYQEAGELFRWALERSAEDEQAYLITANNYARLLMERGEYGRSESLNHEIIERYGRMGVPRHPRLLSAQHNLAETLQKQGHRQQAYDLFDQVWRARVELLGEQHADTLASFNGLITLTGETDPAQAVLKLEAFFSRCDWRDENSPWVVLVLRENLGKSLLALGRVDQAAKVLSQLLERKQTLLGPRGQQCLATQWTLGECLLARDDTSAAERHFRAVQEQASQSEAPRYSGYLGRFLISCGRQDEGLALLWQAYLDLESRGLPDAANFLTDLDEHLGAGFVGMTSPVARVEKAPE